MKKTCLILIALIGANVSFAQNQAEKQEFNSVMIIPFEPNMYFSDADDALAKYNEKTVKEVRTMFRYGLNVNLNARILSLYQTRPLLTDTTHGAKEDLYAIYKGISYFKDKSMPNLTVNEQQHKLTGNAEKKPLLRKTKEEETINAHTTSKLRLEESKDYMNVKISNPEMLTFLHRKYGTELFVFINQFDLVTNYEHCLDRSTNTFERDIRIHFSIFDSKGKQLAGDMAIARFASNTNNIMEIMRSNFPIVSDYLAGNLPKKIKEEKSSYEKDLEYLEQLKEN